MEHIYLSWNLPKIMIVYPCIVEHVPLSPSDQREVFYDKNVVSDSNALSEIRANIINSRTDLHCCIGSPEPSAVKMKLN